MFEWLIVIFSTLGTEQNETKRNKTEQSLIQQMGNIRICLIQQNWKDTDLNKTKLNYTEQHKLKHNTMECKEMECNEMESKQKLVIQTLSKYTLIS